MASSTDYNKVVTLETLDVAVKKIKKDYFKKEDAKGEIASEVEKQLQDVELGNFVAATKEEVLALFDDDDEEEEEQEGSRGEIDADKPDLEI